MATNGTGRHQGAFGERLWSVCGLSDEVSILPTPALRKENGPECPRCGSGAHYYLASRRVWKCRDCAKQYSVKVGMIFEDSPIKLDKWLCAIWLIANSKNGISSHELGRVIGVTQKSAWFMLHRIRLAMHRHLRAFRRPRGSR